MNVVLNLELILLYFFSLYTEDTISKQNNVPVQSCYKTGKKTQDIKATMDYDIQQDVFFQIIQNKFHWCNNLIE